MGTRNVNASACPSTIAATAHQSGSPPSTTASAPSTYITGFRKNVKLIVNRSRQPTVRSSAGTGSTPNSSTAGTGLPDGRCRRAAAVPREEVGHDPDVLGGVVEQRRVARAGDHVLLGVRDRLE